MYIQQNACIVYSYYHLHNNIVHDQILCKNVVVVCIAIIYTITALLGNTYRGQLYTSNDLSSDTEATLVPLSLYVTHQTWSGYKEVVDIANGKIFRAEH